MVSDGYVESEEAKIDRSAIMQDFAKKNNNNNNKKWPAGSHFGFFCVKFVMGYPCVRHYIFHF